LYLRPTPPKGAPSKTLSRVQFFEGTELAMLAHLEKGKGINLNNPIYAGIIGFFRLDNKKENLFLKKFVVIICVYAVFVVSLYPI
jgi:hypothetical protein